METVLKAIADWIKGILTAGIMSNLSGLMPTVLVFFFAYFYLLSLIKHCLFTFFNIT